jgi:hypothetical protein
LDPAGTGRLGGDLEPAHDRTVGNVGNTLQLQWQNDLWREFGIREHLLTDPLDDLARLLEIDAALEPDVELLPSPSRGSHW